VTSNSRASSLIEYSERSFSSVAGSNFAFQLFLFFSWGSPHNCFSDEFFSFFFAVDSFW